MSRRRALTTAALVVVAATLLGLTFASRSYLLSGFYPDSSLSFGEALVPALADWYAWALLAPAMYWLVVRLPIETGRWARSAVLYLAAGAVIATVKFGVDYLASRAFLESPISLATPSFIYRFYANFMTYGVIIAVAHAIEYGRRYRDRQLRASELEARLAQVQLQVLRMQLQPHFLFNTLHSISTLMHRDVEAADRMLVQLGDLLRLTIDRIGVQEVSLKEELDFLRGYLEIEETRFQDRLKVTMEVERETLDARVPNLILQPIVENAIRHGIGPRSAAGRIEVRSLREDGKLRISVRDDGPGIAEPGAGPIEGLGLSNIRARLEGWYGAEYELDFENHPEGGLVVTLSIPYRIDADSTSRTQPVRADEGTSTDRRR